MDGVLGKSEAGIGGARVGHLAVVPCKGFEWLQDAFSQCKSDLGVLKSSNLKAIVVFCPVAASPAVFSTTFYFCFFLLEQPLEGINANAELQYR